jgi:ATPase family protein associated with various cellular activities (AAA)
MTHSSPDPPTRADPRDALSFLRVRELTWHDLVLPDEVLSDLRGLAAEAATGGLRAIVSGESGVGKTMAVQTCAEQLRLDTWRVDCRLLVELYGTETAAALPAVLAAGERPHAVLLFHDAEWLFEHIAGDAAGGLLALAAARRPPTILETRHPELVATRDEIRGLTHVALPFPDEDARGELWRRLAWRAHPLLTPDVGTLAARRVSGAAIEQTLDEALDVCSPELPSTDDLLRALARMRDAGRPPPLP